MTDWNKILDWKLLGGSHDFPGPDGGTCVNEAAIVAAGFPYKSVQSWTDLPGCFSPVLGAIAILLNDKAPSDHARQLLLPIVVKLAGSYKSVKEETRYAEIFAHRSVHTTNIPKLVEAAVEETVITLMRNNTNWLPICKQLLALLADTSSSIPVPVAAERLATARSLVKA